MSLSILMCSGQKQQILHLTVVVMGGLRVSKADMGWYLVFPNKHDANVDLHAEQ